MKVADFPSHCGSKILYDLWGMRDDSAPWPLNRRKINLGERVPALFDKTLFAIYVDNPKQRKTYVALSKEFKILYQSPVLVNPGTGNEYFIVIYLNEKP